MGEPGAVLVGGGECCAHTAAFLRERGWSGPITVVGREPILAYERPPLSKALLTSARTEPVHPYGPEQLAELGVRVLTAMPVEAVLCSERAVELADGTRLDYDRLLLAVGAEPRRLPFPESAGLLYLRTHEDALRIAGALTPGRRIAVVGAGLIGLELAASAWARGCQVCVIEADDRAARRAIPAVSASHLVELHLRSGVGFRWATRVMDVERVGADTVLSLSTGEALVVDAVVVGIGAVPVTGMAEAAGLAVDDGIVTDDRLATSAPDVFAAGDCVSFPHPVYGGRRVRLESWRNALDQARTVAANMTGADKPHRAVPSFWSEQYDHTLHVAGLASLARTSIIRNRDGLVLELGLDAEGRLVSASGLGPGNSAARDVRAAEAMMRDGVTPDASLLADVGIPLAKVFSLSRWT
jgi:3-phenylpropionate/trans-cinnamate dioxygenase ferredoxin reductase subunit